MAKPRKLNPAEVVFWEAVELVRSHPLFSAFTSYTSIYTGEASRCPPHLAAVVSSLGNIHCRPNQRLQREQWCWVLGHCLLHLGLEHHREHAHMDCWTLACDEAVHRLLASIHWGEALHDYREPPTDAIRDEELRYRQLVEKGANPQVPRDLLFEKGYSRHQPISYPQILAQGVRLAVENAVARAAGIKNSESKRQLTPISQARDWFLAGYPLLGALASAFQVVEDLEVCRALGIEIAAISEEEGTIYFNPSIPLKPGELRFIMAHEFLHAGLSHGSRCGGRDPWLWNVACDFVINGWLIEMGVGDPPQLGMLHDPELKGLSAEEVYERIGCDARRCARLRTFRGSGKGDLLGPGQSSGDWLSLDDFHRRCLSHGLELHQRTGRGLLPAGLVEAIRALEHPPIPWDVELAHWLDHFFPPLERLRSYARPSRRQQACPDIPRPSRNLAALPEGVRTFGVVLDTSGSMDRQLLGKALGAIAAYAETRDVPAVRLICCDAAAYDLGYLAAEAIADRIALRGRGGTVLQPGLDLLHRAPDFPRQGPVLIITDGYCDTLQVQAGRKHAYLLPTSSRLPFVPRGPVFRIR